jgi:hypothetical protein
MLCPDPLFLAISSNHKIDMKVKKDCQVIISPLIQSMLGFRQAIFPAGEYVSDWVVDVFPQIPDIIFLLGVCNNRGKLSYRNDELVSF